MADIIHLIRADQLHITRWAAKLGQLSRQASTHQCRPELVTTWQTLARLIDLHLRADEEICAPAVTAAMPQRRAIVRETQDTDGDIREIIRETGLQPPGSPLWWQLATIALSAWADHVDHEEHGPLTDYRRRASPALHERLARQWRAFMEAQIRDQYPQAPPRLPTCQLRQTRPAAPRLADPAFSPLACTCQACTDRLDQAPAWPAPSGRER